MSVTDKIAREILSGTDGDYDLAGYDTMQVETLVSEAFSAPITCTEMMRCSFVIGGGKKVRAKYAVTLGKDVTSALIAQGFTEDKAAAASIDSQGTFKYQHNTGTDLKSVHVFPFVNLVSSGGGGAHGGDDAADGEDDGRFSPLKLCIAQAQDDFMQTVLLKVKSYGQKKKLHKYLKRVEGDIEAIEAKLVAMEALTPSEEEIYGSAKDLTDKVSWLEGEMKSMIDNGQLTTKERQYMLGQLSEKVATVQAQLDKARVDGANEKKIAKYYATLAKLNEQVDKITMITSIKRDIKHAMDIAQLKYRLSGLDAKIDNNTATIEDMNEAGRMRSKIAGLEDEQAELYWFEDHDLVEKIVVAAKKKKATGGGHHSSSSSSSSSSAGAWSGGGGAWSTASSKRGGGGGSSATAASRKGGNAFAGLSID